MDEILGKNIAFKCWVDFYSNSEEFWVALTSPSGLSISGGAGGAGGNSPFVPDHSSFQNN